MLWTSYVPIVVSLVALVIAALAYLNARENFRFQLFEARLDIYNNLLTACSFVVQFGSTVLHPNQAGDAELDKERRRDFLIARERSCSGVGHHKVRMLFGPDIVMITDEISKHFASIAAFDEVPGKEEKVAKSLERVKKLLDELPKAFEPYLYFGHINSHWPGPLNRAYRGDHTKET